MIRPLRQRHRVMISVLGILLPVALAVGIADRRSVPVASVPPELEGKVKEFAQVIWTKGDLWPGQRIITTLRCDNTDSVGAELAFGDLAKPDVLVYWAAGKESARKSLPDNARLLGALVAHVPLLLPAEVREEPGCLVLYSLADHEIVATSNPFTVQKN